MNIMNFQQHYTVTRAYILNSFSLNMEQSTLNFIYFLAVIGAITLAVFLAKVIWSLVKMILPEKNFMDRYGENTWVVITGGSDGIGLGFCQQFAALGFNICIVARNEQKMIDALEKIKLCTHKKILTHYIVADFTRSTVQGFYSYIFDNLKNKGILQKLSILVNNVGISNIGYLHQISDQRLLNEITVNCIPCVLMSNYAIPHMLRRDKRSAIINVSSFSAEHPCPYVTNYSATKAFVDSFSQALSLEYENQIDILSLRPMYVESNMSKQRASFTVASRNQCAKSAIRMLGIDYQTNGYWVHKLISYMVGLLPKPFIRGMSQSESKKIMQKENGTHLN